MLLNVKTIEIERNFEIDFIDFFLLSSESFREQEKKLIRKNVQFIECTRSGLFTNSALGFCDCCYDLCAICGRIEEQEGNPKK